MKFHGNMPNEKPADTYGQMDACMDRHDDDDKHILRVYEHT
jgi:hypothetical protein